jgi:acetylornithine deacetylase/succinyl-diaminopimelate desuccinylase-like protein
VPIADVDFTWLDSLIDRDRLTADLVDLVQCQSVNPFGRPPTTGHRENDVAELYGDKMRELGLDVETREIVRDRSNVWARYRRGKQCAQTIMLAGHLDTVGVDGYPRPFEARIENGRLFGRGSCDMKAALAAYLEVVRVLQAADDRLGDRCIDLLITGICDEEDTMIGSADMGRHGPYADIAIIGEPTDLEIAPTHKGQICLVITTFGTAVHSSRPDLGQNAIAMMARVIEALGTYAENLRHGEEHPLCGTATTNPGVISGGSIASTVPDVCRLEIDRRTLPGQTLELVMAELRALLDPLTSTGPPFAYDISEPTLMAQPLDTPLDHPVVSMMVAAVGEVLGRTMTPLALPAATDAPNLGIPAVICGPGSLSDAHTLNESVAIDDVLAATKVYLRAILSLSET